MRMLSLVEDARRKSVFYDELKSEWDMHSVDNLVKCLGDFNGHISRHIEGSNGAHGECGLGQTDSAGEFCLEKELCVKYIV